MVYFTAVLGTITYLLSLAFGMYFGLRRLPILMAVASVLCTTAIFLSTWYLMPKASLQDASITAVVTAAVISIALLMVRSMDKKLNKSTAMRRKRLANSGRN